MKTLLPILVLVALVAPPAWAADDASVRVVVEGHADTTRLFTFHVTNESSETVNFHLPAGTQVAVSRGQDGALTEDVDERIDAGGTVSVSPPTICLQLGTAPQEGLIGYRRYTVGDIAQSLDPEQTDAQLGGEGFSVNTPPPGVVELMTGLREATEADGPLAESRLGPQGVMQWGFWVFQGADRESFSELVMPQLEQAEAYRQADAATRARLEEQYVDEPFGALEQAVEEIVDEIDIDFTSAEFKAAVRAPSDRRPGPVFDAETRGAVEIADDDESGDDWREKRKKLQNSRPLWPSRALPENCQDPNALKLYLLGLIKTFLDDRDRQYASIPMFYEVEDGVDVRLREELNGYMEYFGQMKTELTVYQECPCGAFRRYLDDPILINFYVNLRRISASQAVTEDVRKKFGEVMTLLDNCPDEMSDIFERHCDKKVHLKGATVPAEDCEDVTEPANKQWLLPIIKELERQARVRIEHRNPLAYDAFRDLVDSLLDLYRANTPDSARAALSGLLEFHNHARTGLPGSFVTPEFQGLIARIIRYFGRCLSLEAPSEGFSREVSPAGTVLVRGPCADGQTVALVSGERGDTVLNTARCRNGKVTLRTHVNAEGYRDPLQVRIGERLYPVE